MTTTSNETHQVVGSRSWNVGRISRITVMLVFAALFVLPIVGFVAMAFRSQEGIEAGGDGFLGLGGMSWENVVYSWGQLMGFGPGSGGVFLRWIGNSLIIAVVGGVLALVAALPAGYALARLRFGSRRFWLFATLLAMVMPNTVLVIPLFLEVNAIGAVGQLWPVAVIMGFFPFGTYLSYIHFMTTMPPELVEAARIDGLGEVAIFFQVALPIAKQVVALIAFFSFVANWTNFFLPLALLTSNQDNKTISIGIQELIGASPLFNATVAAGLDVKLYMPQLALATVISMIPLLVVFLGAQRFLIRGQTVGAVKG
ncbi:carbohydrate ABC transporter permease [Agromyces marinus]|uniref:Sugar ABC transporter permease n=1 Tax=Agromyces marinus TaxID=1389020 RepID=A0ABM8H0T2_9MICO|nr:carbohydrate ABC transporter permease [Agromyces marinus]UIP57515.1 L-arabinose transport system permease protein AraQ [Agromyces marinus]BDZ54348.1 sugar ABC transporter permease [Agromyces marinus]